MKKMIGGNPTSIFQYIPTFLLFLIIGIIVSNLLAGIISAKINTIISATFGSVLFIIILISMFSNLIPAPYKYINLLIVFVFIVLSNIITLFYDPDPVIYIPFYDEMNSFVGQLYGLIFDKKTQKAYNDANKKASSSSSGSNNSE
jgi:hypothetical protein